jgi:hypothetical protein
MKIDGIMITRQQAQWLIDREPLLQSAGNDTELEWRLRHLAEGCLARCILPDNEKPSDYVNGIGGGSAAEKKLWQEFLKTLKGDL